MQHLLAIHDNNALEAIVHLLTSEIVTNTVLCLVSVDGVDAISNFLNGVSTTTPVVAFVLRKNLSIILLDEDNLLADNCVTCCTSLQSKLCNGRTCSCGIVSSDELREVAFTLSI